ITNCARKFHASSKRKDKSIPTSTAVLHMGFLHTTLFIRQSRSHTAIVIERKGRK
ncbi:hypothetical protein TNCT_427171, partial [Trichonephila clavata]